MNVFQKTLFLLNKKEKTYIFFISFINIIGVLVEMISFALIIPVFNIIFFEKYPSYIPDSYINFFIFDNSFKILILIFFIIIFFLKNILLIYINFLTVKFYNFLNQRISNDLFKLYLTRNYSFFVSDKSDFFIRKLINDTLGTKTFLNCTQNLIVDILLVAALVLLLSFVNLKLFFFFVITFLFVILFYFKIIKKRVKNWSYLYQENLGKLQTTIIEFSRGIKDIILYDLGLIFFKKYSFYNFNSVNSFFKIDFISNVQRFWMEIVAVIAVFFPLIVFLLLGKSLDNLISVFALLTAVLFKIIPTFNRIIGAFQQQRFYKPSFDLVFNEFFKKKNESIDIVANYNFKNVIEFKNVFFSYLSNNQLPILKNINLKIYKGESVAILGSNGSGKSTFLNLLTCLVEPSDGQILIDGNIDITKIKKSWIKNLSYVQQNIFLLNDSIKNNIMFGDNKKIDIEKYNEILHLLNLDEIFKNFSNKLDTIVNIDRVNLSGGQKQLISIARALYKDTDIIIFDEANSALDYNYLNILKDLLIKLKNQKTIILVTHETRLLENSFDKIFKINSGNLILEKIK
jgi:ABC-type multidrug transport system fused ATPase/permease subunit